jgi:hypothetical protein
MQQNPKLGTVGRKNGLQLNLAFDYQDDALDEKRNFSNQRLLMFMKFFALRKSDNDVLYKSEVIENGKIKKVEVRHQFNKELGPINKTDQELLMYTINKVIKLRKAGLNKLSGDKIVFAYADYRKDCGKPSSGKHSKNVQEAINRLMASSVQTNIELGNQGIKTYYNWVETASVSYDKTRRFGDDPDHPIERIKSISIKLSSWILDAIAEDENSILSYSNEYSTLKSPVLQRIYEIARCNTNTAKFKIPITYLANLIGDPTVVGSIKSFKSNMKRSLFDADGNIKNKIPDHSIYLYASTNPEASCDWSKRVSPEDQFVVLVRGDDQKDCLKKHLSEIPDYSSQLELSILSQDDPSVNKTGEITMQ